MLYANGVGLMIYLIKPKIIGEMWVQFPLLAPPHVIVLANYEVAGVDQYDYLPVSLDDISELNSWCHEAW